MTRPRHTFFFLAAVAALTAVSMPGGAPHAQTASGAAAPRGKTVYDQHCVECHGATGRGDGTAAPFLTPQPRDFTVGRYKLRTTESGSIPTDDDLARSVREGLPGSAMPAWKGLLSDADIDAVVAYVKSFSPRFASEQPNVVTLGSPVASTPQSVARGQQVYDKLKCTACHGTDGRGAGAVQNSFEDDWKHPLRATDLTEPWMFHGGSTPRDIYLRFRTGMSGTPMPSFVGTVTDAEMWDLANYVASLDRKPLWEMNAEEVQAFYTRQNADERANPVKRGAELVEALACTLCHSPVDEQFHRLPGMRLAGGLRIHIGPFGDFISYNLTSDKETGLGNWTDEQIKQAVTRGTRPDGSRMMPFPMDWASYSTLTPQDLDALVAYLRTVPPISNRTPSHRQPFLPVYLWGKFKLLMLGDDPPIAFFPGNAGSRGQ
jgi:cbb3-type cytochrome c oxidase subunit III